MKEEFERQKSEWMKEAKDDVMKMMEEKVDKAAMEIQQVKWKEDLDSAMIKIKLEIKDDAIQSRMKEKRPKEDLTEKRAFTKVPGYGGKHEEYDDWKFHMNTFLSGADPYMKVLMVRLEKVKTVPDYNEVMVIFDDVNRAVDDGEFIDRRWVNHQLYQVLCLNLRGKALTTVKNLKDEELHEVNGVIGWCKLAQEVSAMTSQRLQGLAGKVYSPKRCKKYNEVTQAIEEWELNVKLFERTENIKLSPQTRIFSVRQIVPEELERDIICGSSTLTTFEKVHAYIAEQVSVRRDVKNEAKGPVQMEMEGFKKTLATLLEEDDDQEEDGEADYGYGGKDGQGEEGKLSTMEQLLSFVKGYKGGGKGGKGKGKFDGNCHHCGVYGHRIGDCWKKDQEVKGKGKDGGNSYYGPKGKGKGYDSFSKGGKGLGGFGSDNKGGGGWKGSDSWKGNGKGYGKSSGSAYGFGNYEEAASQAAWTLSLSKVKRDVPPGLHSTPVVGKNCWNVFENLNETELNEEQEQRANDLAEISNSYLNSFPKDSMKNYSKNQIRQMKGGEKKIKFVPIEKTKSKLVP